MLLVGLTLLLVWVSRQYGRHPDTMNQVLSREKEGTLLSGEESSRNMQRVQLSPVADSKLAMLSITTEKQNGILSSEQELGIQMDVKNYGRCEKKKIKGRVRLLTYMGELEEKPSIQLSFFGETPLFDKGRGSRYTLLSGYHDKSLVRTLLTGRLYEYLGGGKSYAPFMKLVNVEVDGQYQGVYLLCETIEPGEDKIPIDTKAGMTPQQSGFLMHQEPTGEMLPDNLQEGENWFWLRRKNYRMRILSPIVSERRRKEFAAYCKNSVDHIYDDIINRNWEAVGREIDVDSALQSFLTAEIANPSDVERAGLYIYKKPGGRLVFGPLSGCEMNFGGCEAELSGNPFFGELMENDAFREIFRKEYKMVCGRTETFLRKKLNRIIKLYGRDLENDYNYWEKNTDYGSEKMRNANSYTEQITILQEWIHARFLKLSALTWEDN